MFQFGTPEGNPPYFEESQLDLFDDEDGYSWDSDLGGSLSNESEDFEEGD